MQVGLEYVLGSLAALLATFGAFMLLRARHRETEPGCPLVPASRRAAWSLVVVGAGGLLLALLLGGTLAR